MNSYITELTVCYTYYCAKNFFKYYCAKNFFKIQ